MSRQRYTSQMRGHKTTAAERQMQAARAQAQGYARALDESPPFLIIVDIGRAIEIWADFQQMGQTYLQYPDQQHYRIELTDLRDAAVRKRLAAIWTDPLSLDPENERERRRPLRFQPSWDGLSVRSAHARRR